ncbi:metal-dependent hydrolase [Methylomagnum ishizawai]|uniref:metal-dependent hydrolase n=1 Tax=Methylomagnum ishizawai TaxID=1760988 RepID=UPI001C340A5B|nr:metal-dependent hydrolase [Methylomagnum ishizawai]BBL74967.1 membrane protein [Methylomagnum ishizawai]
MANFKTHLYAASGIGGLAAIACMKAGAVSYPETPLLLALGTLGGLLPDIDSEHSVPVRIGFNLLALALAFLVMFQFAGKYTVLELAAIWLAVFLAVRYGVLEVFNACTRHRGIFHSVLAAVFFALCTVDLSAHLFDRPNALAWLHGAFIGMGYLVHLVLDEMYSVDLLNRRLKLSFGSALKPASFKNWRATLLMALAVVMVYSAAPSPEGFRARTWSKLEAHYAGQKPWLIPDAGHWFDNLGGTLKRWLGLGGGA